MDKIILIYDDTVEVPEKIKTIVGKSSYGEIKPKRKTVYEQLKEIFDNINNVETKIIKIESKNNEEIRCNGLLDLYIFSNYVVKNENKFQKMLKDILSKRENCCIVQGKKLIAVATKDIQCIENIMKKEEKININDKCIEHYKKIEENNFLDISEYENLLTYIFGKLDVRCFNSLEVDEDIIIKKSTNKNKIKKEYMFYKLLPEKMKEWMVEPYNYKENDKSAQYTMKRMYATDIAIRWTHKAIDEKEFIKILDKTFFYINNREKRNVTQEEYKKIEKELYVNKLRQRIAELKKHKLFDKLEMHIKNGTKYDSIEKIYEYYMTIYKKYENRNKEYISVISHGDLCFSNMIYDKKNNELKLIDPRGTLEKEEMWTNPYYDVAKLSHSICGNYDFFNHGRYDIILNDDLQYELNIHNDNYRYKELFKEYLKENKYDYELVRIYEASLFLSMLPLHMDYPQKVFGFLLNGINILKEIEGV